MALDRKVAPEVHPIGHLQLPEVSVETLNNGIELRMLNGGNLDINQIGLCWQGGGLEAPSASIAHLAATLLREGAGSISGAEISELLDFKGAFLKTGVNEHYTSLTLSSLNRMCDEALLDLFSMLITQPEYPERALNVYKESAIKSLQVTETKVSYQSQCAIAPLIMGSDNPASWPNTVEKIANASRDDLLAFHHKVFTAQNCKAYLSGRISDDFVDKIKRFLESLPSNEPCCSINSQPYHAQSPQEIIIDMPQSLQSSVRIAFPAPRRSHPDYIPLRFTVMALGGFFGSRLMKNIREDKGYTYGIHSFLLGTIDGSYVSIAAECAHEHVQPLIEEVKHELSKLATVPMDNDELMRLRQHISSSLIETLDSPFTIMDYYNTMVTIGLPQNYFARQVELARSIQPEIIMEMAAKYLRPSEMRIAIAGAV